MSSRNGLHPYDAECRVRRDTLTMNRIRGGVRTAVDSVARPRHLCIASSYRHGISALVDPSAGDSLLQSKSL
jgi:hypothetical protein